MQPASSVHAVDQRLPNGQLAILGLQHVLVMYAGAVAVPLIVGRALQLSPEQVAMLISADLFCCGLVTLIQSWGATQWFGIRLPVMMGVTFAAVAPMVAMANSLPGMVGAQTIFGAVIGAGAVSILIAPFVSRMLRFFPPVVTGTIILVIGISLMRVGIAALVLISILLIAKYAKGFIANIAVLLGIVIGAIVATGMGIMNFDKVAKAGWFDVVMPFQFGMPIFDPILILTMTLVMIVVMIESTGMFLALGEMTGKEVTQQDLARGLRTDGLGTLIGGIFNTFPYTSFSQNVGLVGVTGVKSRFVCVAGGLIMVALGLFPKMAALVESLPAVVLGGAGLVMFGMVAATGVRILAAVDFQRNRNNLFIVAISISIGMIPLVAPNFKQWMPRDIHPLIDSGILLASISAVLLNAFFNGGKGDVAATVAAARQADGGH